MQPLKQSTAFTVIVGPILDSAGAEYTSAVIGDLSISKNGTEAAMASAATLTHVSNGHYTLVGTTGNSDTLGRLDIRCNKSTYQMPPLRYEVLASAAFDTLVTNGTLASTTSGRTIVVDAAGLADANAVKLGPTGSGVALPAALGTNLNTIFNTDYTDNYDTSAKGMLVKLANKAMGGSSLALTTGAISGTTLTLSGAVALQSTLTVSGATSLAALSTSGTTTLNALTVTNATNFSGAVALGSTLTVTGATTLAALGMTTLTASGAVAFQSTWAITGAITATSASNNLRINGVAPGASGGLLISGSNSGTTTLGALTVTGGTTFTGDVNTGNLLISALALGGVNFPTIDPSFGLPVNAVYGNGVAFQSSVRAAVGLASANLDTLLGLIYGVIDTEVATANANISALVTTVGVAGAGLTSVALTSAYDYAKGTVAMTESYSALHAAPTPIQATFEMRQYLLERTIAGVTETIKKTDGSTTAYTETLDSATTPTTKTRAT